MEGADQRELLTTDDMSSTSNNEIIIQEQDVTDRSSPRSEDNAIEVFFWPRRQAPSPPASSGSVTADAGVWQSPYPCSLESGKPLDYEVRRPKRNYMVERKGPRGHSWQRVKFKVGAPKSTPISEFVHADDIGNVICLGYTTRHSRHLEWNDDSSHDTFIKNHGSMVKLLFIPDADCFAGAFSAFEVDVYVDHATSTTASNTREGWAKFVVPGLPDDHPAKLQQYRVTVVQQAHVRAADGTWCWGPDTSIRDIAVEPFDVDRYEPVELELDGLRIADNEVSEAQTHHTVTWEEEEIEKKVYDESSDDAKLAHFKGVYNRAFCSRLAMMAWHLDVYVTEVYVSGCLCVTTDYADLADAAAGICKFCRPAAPLYERLWAERVRGAETDNDIPVVPHYDESGAGDLVLHERDGHLTGDGHVWLAGLHMVEQSGETPSYVPRHFDYHAMDRRIEALIWHFGAQPCLGKIAGMNRDLFRLRYVVVTADLSLTQAQEHWNLFDSLLVQVSKQVPILEAVAAAEVVGQDTEFIRLTVAIYCRQAERWEALFGPSDALTRIQESTSQCSRKCRRFSTAVQRPADFTPDVLLAAAHGLDDHLYWMSLEMTSYIWNKLRSASWAPEALRWLPYNGSFDETWGIALPELVVAAACRWSRRNDVRHWTRMAYFLAETHDLCNVRTSHDDSGLPSADESVLHPDPDRHAWAIALIALTTELADTLRDNARLRHPDLDSIFRSSASPDNRVEDAMLARILDNLRADTAPFVEHVQRVIDIYICKARWQDERQGHVRGRDTGPFRLPRLEQEMNDLEREARRAAAVVDALHEADSGLFRDEDEGWAPRLTLLRVERTVLEHADDGRSLFVRYPRGRVVEYDLQSDQVLVSHRPTLLSRIMAGREEDETQAGQTTADTTDAAARSMDVGTDDTVGPSAEAATEAATDAITGTNAENSTDPNG